MKTKNILMITLLVIATCAIAIVSCTKEKQEKASNNKELIVSDADNMDDYLLAFKEKLLTAEKGGETIGLEQALRDLGNLLNYDFGDANYATDMFQNDTLYVKLSCNNGFVDLSQLAVTYNEALSKIRASFQGIDLPDKSVYMISSEYDEAGSRDGNTEDMRIVVTYRGLGNNTPNTHDTLDWKVLYHSGSCDGSVLDWCAGERMQKWLREAEAIPSCENGRLYYTDQGNWSKNGYQTYDATADRYKIFTVFTYRIDTVCISHEDMEYYFDNTLDYWYVEKPSNHIITGSTVSTNCIHYEQPNVNNYPGDCWYWVVVLYHAKPNCTSSDPLE